MNDYFSSYSALPRNQLARCEAVNAIFDAVIVGFDTLPHVALLKQDRLNYAVDSGAKNAYVVTLDSSIVALTAGLRITMKVGTTNDGPSTVNPNSLGAITVKRFDGSDVSAGDLQGIVIMVYDGTNLRLVSQHSSEAAAAAASAAAAALSASAASTSAGAASGSASAAATSAAQAAASATTAGATVSQWAVAAGTVDAITAVFPTTVTSLTDGLVLGFRASGANATTTPTFKADGTTAHTITKQGGGALVAGDITGNLAECIVRYNLANTRWELLNPAKPYGATTGSGPVVLATSPALTTPNLGTPSAGVLTSCTGLPVSTGVSGLGTGAATALAVNVGTAGAFVVNGGALGTPSSGTLTSCTGLPVASGISGLGTGVATLLAATPSGTGSLVGTSLPSFATTIGVGGATASASGSGVSFPASQSGSSDANTLDDYEEGTWTPADGSGASLTFTGITATYEKIGRLVCQRFQVTYPATADGSNATISGLPFTTPNSGDARQGFIGACNISAAIRLQANSNATTINFLAAAGSIANNSQCTTGTVAGTVLTRN